MTGDLEKIARDFAKQAGVTVVVSGATDIVTDGSRILLVENGHPMMGSISGTGCMAASVTGAFAAVSLKILLLHRQQHLRHSGSRVKKQLQVHGVRIHSRLPCSMKWLH